MMNAPANADYPQVVQYQTVQRTSINEQVLVQVPVVRAGEILEYPYIQTTNTMTTTSIMDKGFNSFVENSNAMHAPFSMNPAGATSQVITHQSTEMLMETDQPPANVVSFYTVIRSSSSATDNHHNKSRKTIFAMANKLIFYVLSNASLGYNLLTLTNENSLESVFDIPFLLFGCQAIAEYYLKMNCFGRTATFPMKCFFW